MNPPNYISPHFQKVHYPSSSIRDFRAAEGLNGGQVGDPVKLVNVTKTEYMYKFNDYGGKSFEKAFDEHTARSAEWQDELGLNMYDYGWRNYDPAIGRWMNVDPLAELYESQANYDYSGNNPVRFVDFNGENYGVKITHDDDKKEIHIQANLYFTNSEDLSENIEAIIMWGLSEGTYTTQDGISYDISFDFKAS